MPVQKKSGNLLNTPCICIKRVWYYVVYSAVSLWTMRNVIKDNEQTKHFFIKIYLLFYSRKGPFVVSLRDRWWDIYSERGPLLVPYLLLGARGCQRLHTRASHIVRDDLTLWSVACPWLDSRFSALCLNLPA